METAKRTIDGRTLYVLMLWAERGAVYIPTDEQKRLVYTRAELHSALANARYVLENIKLELTQE